MSALLLQVLVTGLLLPLILALSWFILLYFFAGLIIILAIVLFFCCMLAACIWLYAEAGLYTLDALDGCARSLHNCTISTFAASGNGNVQTSYLAVAVVCNVILVAYVLCLCCWRHQISRTVAIVRECTAVFRAVPLLFLCPFIVMFWYAAMSVYLFGIGGYIITQGAAVWDHLTGLMSSQLGKNSTLDESRADFVSNAADSLVSRLSGLSTEAQVAVLLTIHVVGFVWSIFLIHACYYTTIAGTVARWFFASKRDEKPKSFGFGCGVISVSAWCVFYRHLGSMAFGSLVMTIMWFVQAVLHYLDKHTKNQQAANPVLRVVIKCSRCLVWMLYKSIEALNEFGYIFIAIEGCSLCLACRSVFQLLERKGAQVGTNKMVGGILSLIISFSIPSLCAVICFAWVTIEHGDVMPLWPAVAVFASAFLIASGVTEILRCSIDTIFVAAFLDLDAHGEPLYMSDRLMRGFGLPSQSSNEERKKLNVPHGVTCRRRRPTTGVTRAGPETYSADDTRDGRLSHSPHALRVTSL